MKKEKSFLLNLREKNDKDYFLIIKFYKSPETLLTPSKDSKYYNMDIAENYIYNDNFLKFILLDEYDLNVLSYTQLESLLIFLLDIKNINNTALVTSAITKVQIYLNNKYINDILPARIKEEIIMQTMNENVNSEKFPFNHVIDRNCIITKSLICDNRFLDIIEKRLLNEELSNKNINNIIYILNLSIKLKNNKNNMTYIVNKTFINIFDDVKAKKLINILLKKYKTEKKIIKLKK